MKKLLTAIGLSCLFLSAKSQIVLNEIYSEPGGTNSEFIELYNSAFSTQNLDCITILTYWESGANKGWYVVDLPSATVASKGWYVLAAASPFGVQSKSGVIADANWNSVGFRTGADSYLKKYQVSGATYTDVSPASGTAVTDLSVDASPAGASGHNYFTLVFSNGAFVNGFWGGGSSGTLPSGITSLPNLTVTPAGACGVPFTINFSTLGAVESVNQAPGSDNGYARTSDGKCGAWTKTSASVNHTPGTTNGGAAGITGSLTTSQVLQCNTGPAVSTVTYNITGVSGSATEADDFPVEVQLYYDHGTIGQLDGADTYQSSLFDALISDPSKSFTIPQTESVILIYKTKRGCFDKVFSLTNGCIPLPVNFKSFTAVRNRSNVLLKWETTTEQNCSGYALERNTGNSGWQQIAFIPTQAPGGNSNDLLTYQYNDLNTAKGVTQYRVKQSDNDGKSRLSDIRSVRGDGQIGKTIVYPNPSNDGKVNILFEEANVTRDVAVMDMSGRIVKQWRGITNNNITIDNLVPGMYSIRIVAVETGEQAVEKVVVNKR